MNIQFNNYISKYEILAENRYVKNTVCSFFIIIGVFSLFNNVFYCGFTGDENYQALCVKDYKNSPLTMLLFFNGYVWTSVFGFSIMSLRILCRFCYLFSICAGCIYSWHKTKNLFLTSLIFSISCLISNLGGFGIYNWDTGAYPIEALWILAIFIYLDKPLWSRLFIIGIISGVMTATRLPLVSNIIITLYVIAIANKHYNKRKQHILLQSLTVMAIMVVTYLAIIIALAGSLSEFKEIMISDNIISGHSIYSMPSYIWRFKNLFPFVFLSWFPITVCYLFPTLETNKIVYFKNWIVPLFFCIITGWAILRVNALMENYDNPIFGLGLPLLLIPILSVLFFHVECNSTYDCNKTSSLSRSKCIVLLATVFMIGLGSDAMFERWISVFLFPIAIGVIWNTLNSNHTKVIIKWLIFTFVTLSIMWAYKSYKVHEDYVWPDNVITTRGNLPSFPDLNNIFEEIPQDIEMIRTNNDSFTFWGYFRYPLTLEYEAIPEYSIQAFHYSIFNIEDIIPNIKNLDYIFLTFHKDIQETDKPRKALERNGFRIISSKSHYILMQNMHKNEK